MAIFATSRVVSDGLTNRRHWTLELDLRCITVHNAIMAGRILTYLLSILLPISPMFCGQCDGSVQGQSAEPACCGALTIAAIAQPKTCCTANCSGAGDWRSQKPDPRCVDEPSRAPSAPSRSPLPCRHEHCRSAICGQSAVTLRRVDWSANGAREQLSLDHLPRVLAAMVIGSDGVSLRLLVFDADWEIRFGPSGRAARIAYCSWQI